MFRKESDMSDMAVQKDEHGNVLTDFDFEKKDTNMMMAYIGFGIVAIFLGGLAGLLQIMQRSGWITLPNWLTYYELLTAHGVLLGLVFTTSFIMGYMSDVIKRHLVDV